MQIQHELREVREERAPLCGEVRVLVVDGDVSDDEAARLLAGDPSLAARIVRELRDHNLITNTSRERAAALWVAASTGGFNLPGYIGLGTTAITPSSTMTSLTGETYRKACSTLAVFQTYYSRWVANFTTTEVSGNFLGMALFGSSSGGDMHAIVSVSVSKSSSQSLIAEWRWSHEAST